MESVAAAIAAGTSEARCSRTTLCTSSKPSVGRDQRLDVDALRKLREAVAQPFLTLLDRVPIETRPQEQQRAALLFHQVPREQRAHP